MSPRKLLSLTLSIARRRGARPRFWCSSSSISTAASNRLTRSEPIWDCRRSAWCLRSIRRPGKAATRSSTPACRRISPKRSGRCEPTCCSPPPTRERRSLVVTSTGPGEGKSVVAANLAIGLAQAGQRVILIDGDMRRPRVHEMFSQKLEPGLSNLLVGHSWPARRSARAACRASGC